MSDSRQIMRRERLACRDGVSAVERAEKSGAAAALVMGLPQVAGARVVMAYMHFRSEVETAGLIARLLALGKTVAVPCTLAKESRLLAVRITDPERQAVPGYCGIPEPSPELLETAKIDPQTIEAVIVPGSVFDRQGGRMGYGGGFYDRFLRNEAPQAVRIGLAFELQVVDRAPLAPHDQVMDFVVTENKVYDCGGKSHA